MFKLNAAPAYIRIVRPHIDVRTGQVFIKQRAGFVHNRVMNPYLSRHDQRPSPLPGGNQPLVQENQIEPFFIH